MAGSASHLLASRDHLEMGECGGGVRILMGCGGLGLSLPDLTLAASSHFSRVLWSTGQAAAGSEPSGGIVNGIHLRLEMKQACLHVMESLAVAMMIKQLDPA